jgi:small subunit ribosomal protein S6
MQLYETGFLLAPNLSDEESEKIITQMLEVISQKEGKLVRQERWGKRKLAYPVKRFNEAAYIFFHYEGGAEIPLELERRFKQTDTVLRYLTLKRDAQVTVRRKKKKEAAPEAREAAPAAEEKSSGESQPAAEPDEGVK